LRNAFEKRFNSLSQFSNNFVFFVHAPLYSTGYGKAQIAYFNIFRFL
jgi:hypothetical protein